MIKILFFIFYFDVLMSVFIVILFSFLFDNVWKRVDVRLFLGIERFY